MEDVLWRFEMHAHRFPISARSFVLALGILPLSGLPALAGTVQPRFAFEVHARLQEAEPEATSHEP